MTTIGNNMKWTMNSALREKLRAFFEQGLEAKRVKEEPAMDVFSLVPGGTIAVIYVDPSKALTAEQLATSPWLEFLSPKLGDAIARLDKLGVERLEYFDKANVYFKAPGGVVFRIAAAA